MVTNVRVILLILRICQRCASSGRAMVDFVQGGSSA